jgi:hypothetical protein
MSLTEIIEHIKHLSTADQVALIAATAQLVREGARDEQDRRMEQSAKALQDLYAPGGELTERTSLDSEGFRDDYIQG